MKLAADPLISLRVTTLSRLQLCRLAVALAAAVAIAALLGASTSATALEQTLTARVSVERGAAAAHPAATGVAATFDWSWPYAVAFGGIGVAVLGGLLWRRRRWLSDAWPDSDTLGGPSEGHSHSKTNVGDVPVPFTQFGVSVEPPLSPHHSRQAQAEPLAAEAPSSPGADRPSVAVAEPPQPEQEALVHDALSHVERAIGVLRAHIEREPLSLPAAWLMLLDLYRTCGREAEFRQLAGDFHAQFNARAPQWDAQLDAIDPGLEAHPHLIKTLGRLWGTVECRDFLDRLIHDNREGRRSGFTQAAYRDILALRSLLDTVLGEIDYDVIAEREVRAAWTEAMRQIEAANSPAGSPAATASVDLESELDDEIRRAAAKRAARERDDQERRTGTDRPGR